MMQNKKALHVSKPLYPKIAPAALDYAPAERLASAVADATLDLARGLAI